MEYRDKCKETIADMSSKELGLSLKPDTDKHMYVLLNLKLKITQFHDLNLKSALNTCITNTNIMDIWSCTTGIKSDPSH